ncbi:MAG TPA: methyl-accepting chemotaxis protein [Hydrogenophaga sp.]|uniref:methyl-accepting chemotaxis protein n=1 Tax=Hydrogenophaga sp. TaxID=1904254 RepID=UPI002BAB5A36|nr:methyl-accepting chemotaxis protein [Hydrogenophaga sp.]HSX92109.1 methyl-accepting chemotaxis protein [Hydrogenophaga sp.]
MKAIAHLRIGARLTLGFALIIALLASIAGVGFAKLNIIADDIEVILHERYANVALAQTVENETNRQLNALRTALIATERSLVDAEVAKVQASKPLVMKAIEQLRASVHDQRGRTALSALIEQQDAFRQREDLLLEHIKAGRTEEARSELLTHLLPLQARYLTAIEAFAETQAGGMEAYGAEALEAAHDAKMLSGLLALIAVLLAVAIAFVLTRSITQPIAQALRVARTVAAGDLTSRFEVHGKDEMAELLTALRTMNDSLVRIVSEVRESSDSIASGSHQIATGGADLSNRTEEQASSIQQTAASMEEIATAVRHSADTSRTATGLAHAASAVASRGGQAVADVVSTMGSISESSRRIADITGVIDGIAFQTNILALNAAVEAARAGEHGRGFAVVAGEVRTLAQRAATAAKDIKRLIGESQGRVEAGARQVEQAGTTIGDIVAQAGQVARLISALDTSFDEQSRGIGQINEAVSQMDQMTQQNAALVEESAAAAASLRQQAARLSALVDTFRLNA